VNLAEWARLQGIHPRTAYRWFRQGTLPVPAARANSRWVPVAPDAVIAPAPDGIGLYARVSTHDQRAGLDRQVARLTARAAQSGRAVVRDVTEALASFCARLYGRRSARNRAEKALRRAARDAGRASPQVVP